ncbi:MAG: glycerol-3-phosphate acyltransferase [Actinobacteria bacterium]|nr:glycerol-3-phosphate acyltransferase [Actinomycetota bacterium]
MEAALYTVAGFLLGAVPFSLLVGKWLLRVDVRDYGDGNPGAINAGKAGGWPVGLLAGVLDYLKGALPVALAHHLSGVDGWGIVPVAVAPIAGHAFSPFLRFRGGKAIAATFGVWTGLTLYRGPVVLGLSLALFVLLLDEDAWSAVLGMMGLLAYLLVAGHDGRFLAVWCGNMLIVLYRHHAELVRGVRLKPWVLKALRRSA